MSDDDLTPANVLREYRFQSDDPIYIEFTSAFGFVGSAFGFVGRSVYQRASAETHFSIIKADTQ